MAPHARGAAPGGLLRAAPAVLAAGPANGDLSLGLEGWSVLGRRVPQPLPAGRGVLIIGNTTVVSPPLALPAGAQTLRVRARAPAGRGLIVVRARPQEGGPDIELATLELGRRRASLPVGVASLAGRVVRLVVDPVPALGTSVELLRVGPVTAPLRRWRVDRGALEVAGARGRRTVRVAAPLTVRSPAHRPPRVARAVSIDVRGVGRVRASAGGRRVAARAAPGWRPVKIPLRRGRLGAVVLRIEAVPGAGLLELRRLGAVVRTPGRSGG